MPDFPAPPEPPKYATHIEGRYPKFKMHRTLAHARAAIKIRQHDRQYYRTPAMTIYEFKNGQWEPVEEFNA